MCATQVHSVPGRDHRRPSEIRARQRWRGRPAAAAGGGGGGKGRAHLFFTERDYQL
ncbi:unnamed protein product [Spirodela intermedia]|uniref:Uncharacterized protein n=1 Tax=Spirodela intermedia TaxID=51605 RepID=A0A7I8LJY6_SPIIN|nr:unnamed protein product [Spirodela intermedia]